MTEPLAVVFQHRATLEVEQADEWWRTNRPVASDLFRAELERILTVIAVLPTIGVRAKSERAAGVRRVLLKKTRYHVYYRVHDETLEVLAVWHARRGTGPGL
jgi:plasmid stabilization system protein ParE